MKQCIVVTQLYQTEAENEYVIKGNSAVMKCKIPSFVADFVQVEAWIDTNDGTVLTHINDSNASYGCSFRLFFFFIYLLFKKKEKKNVISVPSLKVMKTIPSLLFSLWCLCTQPLLMQILCSRILKHTLILDFHGIKSSHFLCETLWCFKIPSFLQTWIITTFQLKLLHTFGFYEDLIHEKYIFLFLLKLLKLNSSRDAHHLPALTLTTQFNGHVLFLQWWYNRTKLRLIMNMLYVATRLLWNAKFHRMFPILLLSICGLIQMVVLTTQIVINMVHITHECANISNCSSSMYFFRLFFLFFFFDNYLLANLFACYTLVIFYRNSYRPPDFSIRYYNVCPRDVISSNSIFLIQSHDRPQIFTR